MGPSCPVNWRCCVICGQHFVKPPNRVKRTCSDACAKQTLEEARAADFPDCVYCGRPFDPGRNGRKYCSDYCAALSYLDRYPMEKPTEQAIASALARVERERGRSAYGMRADRQSSEIPKRTIVNTHIAGSIALAMVGGARVVRHGQSGNVFSGGVESREAKCQHPLLVK